MSLNAGRSSATAVAASAQRAGLATFSWAASVQRLVTEDKGQDLLEYGLLIAAIAAASVAVLPPVVAAMAAWLGSWGGAVNGIWEPLPPS